MGPVQSCTWAEGSPLQPPAGLHPQATTPHSSQPGRAAHRCGAARTRNLLSHSCFGGEEKKRFGMQFSCQLAFSASSAACVWAGRPAPSLCRPLCPPGASPPSQMWCPRFLCPTDNLRRVGQVMVPAQPQGGQFSPSECPGFIEPSRNLRAISFSVLT